jgi:hypothetical protein
MKSEVKRKMNVALREVVVRKSRRENSGEKSQLKNAPACAPLPSFAPAGE